MPTSSTCCKAEPKPTPWLYGDRLRMVGIKFYADGALGSRGAWLKQPYADKPDTRGLQFHSDAEMRSLADTAASRGFQIATHAIGDAANAQVISTYEWLNGKYGTDRRWRIEHAQIVDCADLPADRPARHHRLDAADAPDQRPADGREAARPGPARGRLRLAVDAENRREAGVRHRLPGRIAQPVPRPGRGDQPAGHERPAAGRLDPERAADASSRRSTAYTRGAAYAGFAEDRIGALEPGKWADFIIVDRDPTKVEPAGAGADAGAAKPGSPGRKCGSARLALRPTERGK